MNKFAKEINERRPFCCNTNYHIKQIALLIDETVSTLQAVYDGEMAVSKQLDAKLCDEFGKPKGYFLDRPAGQITIFEDIA